MTNLEQRVELLEVEVENMEDEIDDIEIDINQQTDMITDVQDEVAQNTDQIFGNVYFCFVWYINLLLSAGQLCGLHLRF